MKLLKTIIGLLLFQTISVFGQGGTEIILMDINTKNGIIQFSNPVNITERVGYDNQPFFHPKKPIIYYSAAVNGQNDIFGYNFKTKKKNQITNSEDSEYSPNVIPGKNKISCIVQRKSNGDQDLVSIDLKNASNQKIILVSAKSGKIGYQAWRNDHQLICFVLGSPSELHFFDLNTKSDKKLAENIGRSLQVIPNRNAYSFKEKVGDKWLIQLLDAETMEISTLATSESTKENYHIWLGEMLIESGGDEILKYDFHTKEWIKLQLPDSLKNKNITRMSAKGKKLAIVIDE